MLFLPSCALGFLLLWLLSALVGMTAFWVTDLWDVSTVKNSLVFALSGRLVPMWSASCIYFLYRARLSGFVWTPLHVAEVLLVVAGGTLIYWSYLTLISSIAFWTMRSQPLVDASMELMARGTSIR
ncbi:MAG: hypothetical protein F4Y91_05585 [Gemmatimonadetes bacterium]|nr:hypothetical protein [Gemmatimonadota bacterium]MYB71425.1 hypothetical protein [Gemmatimonadota bacterium]